MVHPLMILLQLLVPLCTCYSSAAAPAAVSQLAEALGGQDFSVTIAAGGAAVLTDSVSGEHLSTVTSSFSRPGPIWQNFSVAASTDSLWQVTVNHSQAARGRWTVVGTLGPVTTGAFQVERLYLLDPAPPRRPRRLLVNDTITTPSYTTQLGAAAAARSQQLKGVVGIAVRHRATVAAAATDVETAVIPGACAGQQCGTEPNEMETCGVGCFDSAVKRTNYGRPDVFANRTAGASGGAFGLGLVALDDVFRVHAQTLQSAMATGPRMAAKNMSCSVSSPPAIQLGEPMLGLQESADEYTMEWAVYAFRHSPDTTTTTTAADASGRGCTDFYCFVNAQRHDSGAATIRIERSGFLGPSSSMRGDMSVWTGSGYSTCKNVSDTRNPNLKPVREIMSKTCWEHWDAKTFLDFIQKQGGPGGYVHINNGDMITKTRAMVERYPCSEITIDGNRFVDPAQRPAVFNKYFAQVVNQTRAANALLPPGAPRHKTVFYTDNYASTGFNDSALFSDSWVTSADGTQQAYRNCTKPGGPAKAQLLSFYADGKNKYSQMLRKYYALALQMGADGIFHDEFPGSNFHYSYHTGWDNRTVFLDKNYAVRDAPLPSSLVLLGDAFEIELARFIDERGGIMICNGAPETRSWLRNALTAKLPTINENENSRMWRALHTQLYTPIMLTRYGGNKRDSDPRYNHTADCPGPTAVQRRICYTAPCLSFSDHLDYGVLSMTYGSLWKNDTRDNVYSQMVPTTPIEIGEGFVIGLERIVTKRSGTYTAPRTTADVFTGSTIYRYQQCLKMSDEKGGLTVNLQLAAGEIAIVVWGATRQHEQATPLKTDDSTKCGGETLANGLCLPHVWPPQNTTHSHNQLLPPYLVPGGGGRQPLPARPAMIGIDVGRQLFVDSFLIDSARSVGLNTTYHTPSYRDDVNPVLMPDKDWEGVVHKGSLDPNLGFASPFSGGCFWDPTAQHYKLWYRCGSGVQCLAYTTESRSPSQPSTL